jgi:predicted amidohydrolase
LILRAAAVQLNATPDLERNRETADRLVRAAAADGARLVLLPEKWSVLGPAEALRAGAEPLDGGPSMQWARALARELSIDLIAGSIVERTADGLANTCVHVDPSGELRAAYRKLHMFDVEVDGVAYHESAVERAGNEIVTTHAGGVEVGLSICYDVRFPELYRVLAVRGARVLTVPAAFTFATTRDHWETLLRARAIENACFVLAANQIGEAPPKYRSGGRSMIIDPWGLVLAQAGDRESHIVADLDLDALDGVRRRLPSLEHRRADVYEWPATALVGAS